MNGDFFHVPYRDGDGLGVGEVLIEDRGGLEEREVEADHHDEDPKDLPGHRGGQEPVLDAVPAVPLHEVPPAEGVVLALAAAAQLHPGPGRGR